MLKSNAKNEQKETQHNDRLLKLLLVGDSTSGKKEIFNAFESDKLTPRLVDCIGIDFRIKQTEIDGQKIKTQLWDMTGQNRFHEITSTYYHGVHGMLFIYDIGDETSFQSAIKLILAAKKEEFGNVQFILMGHKKANGIPRVVETAKAQEIARKNGLFFTEINTSDKHNIDETFSTINKRILDAQQNSTKSMDAKLAVPLADECKVLLETELDAQKALKLITLLSAISLSNSTREKTFRDQNNVIRLHALKPYKNKIVDALLMLTETEMAHYIEPALTLSSNNLHQILNFGDPLLSFTGTPYARLESAYKSIKNARKKAAQQTQKNKLANDLIDTSIQLLKQADLILRDNEEKIQSIKGTTVALAEPLNSRQLLDNLVSTSAKLNTMIDESTTTSDTHEALIDTRERVELKLSLLTHQLKQLPTAPKSKPVEPAVALEEFETVEPVASEQTAILATEKSGVSVESRQYAFNYLNFSKPPVAPSSRTRVQGIPLLSLPTPAARMAQAAPALSINNPPVVEQSSRTEGEKPPVRVSQAHASFHSSPARDKPIISELEDKGPKTKKLRHAL